VGAGYGRISARTVQAAGESVGARHPAETEWGPMWRSTGRNPWLAACGIVALAAGIALHSLRHKTLTADEPQHYRYGAQLLHGDARRFDDSKMPVSALNAAACEIGARWMPGGEAERGEAPLPCHPTAARIPTVVFAALTGLLVFAWSRSLYGPGPALFSTILFALDPNLIAHSRLVTTDTYATGAILLATYAFWRYVERGGFGRAALAGLCFGASQLAKYTAAYLLPVFALLLLLRGTGRFRGGLAAGVRPVRLAAQLAVLACAGLLAVNAGFLFEGTGTALGGYRFRSDLFRVVQERAGRLAELPLPLPVPYLEGMDWVKANETQGSFGNLYLLGELRRRGPDLEGFAGYFFVVGLFKEPLATLAAVAWALAGLLVWRRERPLGGELFLLVPLAFFAVYFNFFFRAQIGIRFFLVALPFVFILAGSALRAFGGRRWSVPLAGALAAYLVGSVLSYHPHYLSYTNELVPDRKLAYRYVADSNLDWGQNRWYLRRYLREHPGVVAYPREPMPGRLLVDVNRLVGVFNRPRYRWLREGFTPVEHVAHSYLVFEVAPGELGPAQPGAPEAGGPSPPASGEPPSSARP